MCGSEGGSGGERGGRATLISMRERHVELQPGWLTCLSFTIWSTWFRKMTPLKTPGSWHSGHLASSGALASSFTGSPSDAVKPADLSAQTLQSSWPHLSPKGQNRMFCSTCDALMIEKCAFALWPFAKAMQHGQQCNRRANANQTRLPAAALKIACEEP